MAAEAGNAEGVTFLLNQGADKTIKDWVSPYEAHPSPIFNLDCTRWYGSWLVATRVAILSSRPNMYAELVPLVGAM